MSRRKLVGNYSKVARQRAAELRREASNLKVHCFKQTVLDVGEGRCLVSALCECGAMADDPIHLQPQDSAAGSTTRDRKQTKPK